MSSMEQQPLEGAVARVAGSFTFTATLPNAKNCSVSSYILEGDDDASLNARLDQVARAVERQRMIAEIPELEAKLAQFIEARDQFVEIMDAAQAAPKPSHQVKQGAEQALRNLKHCDANIEKGKAAIERARAALMT